MSGAAAGRNKRLRFRSDSDSQSSSNEDDLAAEWGAEQPDHPTDYDQHQPPSKIRRVAHVDGNFAAFVYIDCAGLPGLPQLQAACRNALLRHSSNPSRSSHGGVELPSGSDDSPQVGHERERLAASVDEQHEPPLAANVENPHISLSPLIMLRFQFIDSFLNMVRRQVEELSKVQTAMKSLQQIRLETEVDVLSNEGGNRYFAGLAVRGVKQIDACQRLRGMLEKACGEFDVSGSGASASTSTSGAAEASREKSASGNTVLGKPRPHVSLAWTLERPAGLEVDSTGKSTSNEFGPCCWPRALGAVAEESPLLTVRHITVQIGQRTHEIPLGPIQGS